MGELGPTGLGFFRYFFSGAMSFCINPFKLSGVKWLHFKVFSAILVSNPVTPFLSQSEKVWD